MATISTAAYIREVRLAAEKDVLIDQKDSLIAEKEELISEKDFLAKNEKISRDDAVLKANSLRLSLANTHFRQGLVDYESGRPEAALKDLLQSVALLPATNPLSTGRARVALDRATRRGRSPLPPLRHRDLIFTASFSPDGTRVLTASRDGTARLWDAHTGDPLGEPLRHASGVRSASFDPDGTHIVTASEDNTARLWNAQTGSPIGESWRHDYAVISASFCLDGTRVVTTSRDSMARLWDIRTGQPLGDPLPHGDTVISASFSPDGRRVVTSSQDRTVRVWDAETGCSLGTQLQHEDVVWSASFSPNGAQIVSASSDGSARLWDVAQAEFESANGLELLQIFAGVTIDREGKLLEVSLEKNQQRWNAALRHNQGWWQCVRQLQDERRVRIQHQLAEASERSQDWYAAAFHLSWLLRNEPDSIDLQQRYAIAAGQRDQGTSTPPIEDRELPFPEIPESTLSSTELTYVSRDGKIAHHRFADRFTQYVSCPAGAPRWIDWNRQDRRWLALVENQILALPVDEMSSPEPLWTFDMAPQAIAISPDGQRLAWLHRMPDSDVPHLMIQSFHSLPTQDLGLGYDPVWSSDSRRLICLTWTNRWQIGVWDGLSMKVTAPPFHPLLGVYPAPSVDGKWIAFASYGRGDTRPIALMQAEGTDISQVTRNGLMNMKPVFSPDGRYVAYLTAGVDGLGLRFVDLMSEEETVVTDNVADVRPVWRKLRDPSVEE